MKRAREEEEEKEIEDVDATLMNIPEEMRTEVYGHMQFGIMETLFRATGREPEWHLNSAGQVSKFLYRSIYEVARIHFKQLVDETRRDFVAWGGYTVGRPLSVHERFAASSLGQMNLSFAWCIHHFYHPAGDWQSSDMMLQAIHDRFFGRNPDVITYGKNRSKIAEYMKWLLHLEEDYPGSQKEYSFRPRNNMGCLYMYFRYGTFPPDMQRSLEESLTVLIYGGGSYATKESIKRWRFRIVEAILNEWFDVIDKNDELFWDWLIYFHGRE